MTLNKPSYSQLINYSYDSILANCFSQERTFLKPDQDVRHKVANYINRSDESITFNEIDTITNDGSHAIKNYGKTQLITVKLKHNAPAILYRTFLLLINNRRKRIDEFNVDNYYLLKTTQNDSSFLIGVINNYRGNLQFYLLTYLNGYFSQSNIINLFSGTDCSLYKFGSLSLKNNDIDKDGYSDLRITFAVSLFCNQNGGPYDEPIGLKRLNLRLIYHPNGKLNKWQLK